MFSRVLASEDPRKQLLENSRTACDQINVYFSCSFCTGLLDPYSARPTARLFTLCLTQPLFPNQIDYPGSETIIYRIAWAEFWFRSSFFSADPQSEQLLIFHAFFCFFRHWNLTRSRILSWPPCMVPNWSVNHDPGTPLGSMIVTYDHCMTCMHDPTAQTRPGGAYVLFPSPTMNWSPYYSTIGYVLPIALS